MADKWSVKVAVGMTAAILFGGVGFLGYRFIQDVSRSASAIESQVDVPNSGGTPINNDTLRGTQNNAVSGSLLSMQTPDDGVSSGQDLVIKAGEFAYTHGEPQVRLALVNQGGFNIGGAFLSVNLYLDGSETAVDEPVIVPLNFAHALAMGQETTISESISLASWRAAAVKDAKMRRVVAQIVGVKDKDRNNADYPQTSASVLLRQTANDWSKPQNPNDAVGVSLRETASQAMEPSENIQVVAEQPPEPLQNVYSTNADDSSEFLEKPLPTGEPRILSVEVHTYQDGELQDNQSEQMDNK